MHLITTLTTTLSLLALTTAQMNTTNGLGSTPSDRHILSASQAALIISAAITSATSLQIPENIAVVDPSGLLVAFHRMDNAFLGSIDISQRKARTAVLFNGLSSADLYAAVQPGAPLYGVESTNGGLIVFGGGVPVYVGGRLVGGVGVSGGSVEQDLAVAKKGVEAVGRTGL